jgi:hypothetical protein
VERIADDGAKTLLDETVTSSLDTIVVISFHSLRTQRWAEPSEFEARRRRPAPRCGLRSKPQNIFITATRASRRAKDLAASSARSSLGSTSRLRTALGCGRWPRRASCSRRSIRNARWTTLVCWPASSASIYTPTCPSSRGIGDAVDRVQVLARQKIDPAAPPRPFSQGGRATFDALFQSAPFTFAGRLLICDTTMFSSTAGGLDSLRRLWRNAVLRPRRTWRFRRRCQLLQALSPPWRTTRERLTIQIN